MKTSKPIRILIVEDNPNDESVLLRQLKRPQLDGQIRVIADGNRALNYLTDAKYKCEDLVAVFLNLNLPTVGGGIKLLEAIRGADRLKHLPVIVMTSASAQEELDKCRALGVSAYVSKPVSFSAFVKAIADTFHARKSVSATTAAHAPPEYSP
jgi:CheY-like chemotaxis protein